MPGVASASREMSLHPERGRDNLSPNKLSEDPRMIPTARLSARVLVLGPVGVLIYKRTILDVSSSCLQECRGLDTRNSPRSEERRVGKEWMCRCGARDR